MEFTKTIFYVFVIGVTSLYADPELVGMRDFTGNEVWNTFLSLANEPVAFWEPRQQAENHKALGHHCQPNRNDLEEPLLYVSEITPGGGALKRPEGFNFIWDDRLSTAASSASIFRTFCGDGYVSLGDLSYPDNRVATPEELFDAATCVKTNLTEVCEFGDMLWDDRGMTGTFDVSVWAVNASEDAVSDFFYSVGAYDTLPPVTPRCLLRSAYIPTKRTL